MIGKLFKLFARFSTVKTHDFSQFKIKTNYSVYKITTFVNLPVMQKSRIFPVNFLECVKKENVEIAHYMGSRSK